VTVVVVGEVTVEVTVVVVGDVMVCVLVRVVETVVVVGEVTVLVRNHWPKARLEKATKSLNYLLRGSPRAIASLDAHNERCCRFIIN
jgi:hypothetical protein